MIKHIQLILLLGSCTIALPSFASEMGLPRLGTSKSAKSITSTAYFPGKLKASQFVSSVDNAQNSWRSDLRTEAGSLRVNLKLGEWERPDPETVDTVWLANKIDWTNIQNHGKDLEFSYTFASSSSGVQSIFKFGASLDSVGSVEGDCSFSLIYGQNTCTFRRGDDSTTGELPFTITAGTTVRIRLKSNQSADIWIDDQPILADQAVNLRTNFISIIAKTESPSLPQVFRLSSLTAKLVRRQ